MTRELISKTTRNEFRELLTGYTLHEIEMIFDAGGLTPRADHQQTVSGQRRGLVEAYYANIDFSSAPDVRKLLAAYEEFIERLRQTQHRVGNPEAVEATIEALLRRMARDGFQYVDGRFSTNVLNAAVVHAPTLVQLTEESIQEHVAKARQKIAGGDAAGAITNAYTLVEVFLKQLLRDTKTPFNENEGNIRVLYKLLEGPLNLSPIGESLEAYLKAILSGLSNQVIGLYEIANKASDRHKRRYNPAPHHARLAVNVAFTLCEFLLESRQYQQSRKRQGGAQ
jgi:hypothetical protein